MLRRVKRSEHLRAHARMAAFGSYCTAALGAYELALRAAPAKQPVLLERARPVVARHVLRTLGVIVESAGEARPGPPRLIVANHRAALDIGVVLTAVPGTFLSRGDLADWPVIGRIAKHAGTLFVDRESGYSGASAIRRIRTGLKNGASVIVFPEGTTHRGDEVMPVRPGAFAALRGIDAEVLPVGLAYPHGIEYVGIDFMTHVKRVAARPRTRVCMEIGTPFRPEANARANAERAHGEVAALVQRARARFNRAR